jgi:opacity protein-like surface antigen
MIPARGGSWFAPLLLAAVSILPGSANAQLPFDDIPGFGIDAVARSPRLVAMGRMSYVLEDPQHRIGLWELGRNPVGVADADSGSTVDFGPYSRSFQRQYEPLGQPELVRQDYYAREVRTFVDAWRRDANTTYGISGEFNSSRQDVPYNQDQEIRSEASTPGASAILAGRVPRLAPDRLRYGLRVFGSQTIGTDGYRLFLRNAAGDFISLDGTQISSPGTFVPDEADLRSLGFGGSLSYRVARAMTAAVGYDFATHEVFARNQGNRHASEVREDRPYRIGQASVTGRIGTGLVYGVDARGWTAKSSQDWVYSVSAGSGAVPVIGRGRLLERDEEGSTMRARVHWQAGGFEIGAGGATAYRKVELTPPIAGDITSFNYFLNTLFYRPGADTLALPDSVLANTVSDRSWEAGGGIARAFGRFLVAAEGRYFRSQRDQDIAGAGPRQLGWEAKTGVEWRLSGPIQIRAGYAYLWEDLDDFTEQNEMVVHSATAGLGYRPSGVAWVLDLGAVREWGGASYDHPTAPTVSGQRLAARLRWEF